MNEIRRLYDRIVLAPARAARTWLAMHWHRWRTRHQSGPGPATTVSELHELTHRETTGRNTSGAKLARPCCG